MGERLLVSWFAGTTTRLIGVEINIRAVYKCVRNQKRPPPNVGYTTARPVRHGRKNARPARQRGAAQPRVDKLRVRGPGVEH